MTEKKKKEKSSDFDYGAYEKQVIAGLMEGKGLMGKDGLLKPLIAKFVESALEAELDHHLEEEAKNNTEQTNKRNGKRQKKIRTEAGETPVHLNQ